MVILAILLVLSGLVGYAIGVASSKTVAPAGVVPGDVNKLIKQVRTPENEERIQRMLDYHQRRVNAGADGQESLTRLIRELNELTK